MHAQAVKTKEQEQGEEAVYRVTRKWRQKYCRKIYSEMTPMMQRRWPEQVRCSSAGDKNSKHKLFTAKTTIIIFSSAGCANIIADQKLSVCVLTRVAQIITVTRRDLQPCTHRPSDELRWQTKSQYDPVFGLVFVSDWVYRSSCFYSCTASWGLNPLAACLQKKQQWVWRL